MIDVITDLPLLRQKLDRIRAQGHHVGVVPTMGALHAGHLALVREAARRCHFVVVTVFVNPTQFGPGEDFDKYPRDLSNDTKLSEEAGAHAVFAPAVDVMYPKGERTRVRVDELSAGLCGASRPGHFEGVATVVAKLFNAVGPGMFVFGRKDYQQWRLIERMARDLLFPVEVVGYPLVRDHDGLALSSRNAYLSDDERARSLALPRALRQAHERVEQGETKASEVRGLVRATLREQGVQIDYVEVTDPIDLQPLAEDQVVAEPALLAVAIRIGTTRLIDNLVLGQDAPPQVP